jgi:hypothetical protein
MISSGHLGIQRILQDIITLHLISSLNTSQNITFQKSSYKKIDLLLTGQNLLSYYILYNETKHNILDLLGKANKSTWNVSPYSKLDNTLEQSLGRRTCYQVS